jgi:choice-of-anchor A domain-containing protein
MGLLSSSTWADATAVPTVNDTLAEWNVVTYQNLNQVNEFEGRAFVGGNLTESDSFQVAMGLNGVSSSSTTLVVMGSISGGNHINLQSGSVVVGGSINARPFNYNSGGTVTPNSPEPAALSPLTRLSQSSTYWSTLTANSSISVNGNNRVTFNAIPGVSLAIFNVTDTETFELSGLQGFDLNATAGTTLLINVNSQDGAVNWAQGNFFDAFQLANWKGSVLFNFYNAASVNLHDQFTGYVMAPGADVTANNNIDGGVVANNLWVGSQVHLPNRNTSNNSWYGDLPDAAVVPEPTTSAFAAALGLVAFFRARFSKKN